MGEDGSAQPRYRRVLLKLSGDAFGQNGKGGISIDKAVHIARQINRLSDRGVQLAVVVGGGNIIRGKHFSADSEVISPTTADYMGMLATVLNGMALQEALESIGCEARLQTAWRIENVAEHYVYRRAMRHLEKGRVLILACGTGNPGVTTDTTAALKAWELGCEILLKATRVDGIYSDDPERNPHAVRYDKLTYTQVIRDDLKVMDMQAFVTCKDKGLPIMVFDYTREGAIERAATGGPVGTVVTAGG